MNWRGSKTVFVTGGVFILAAGVLIGAFLVLQSMRAEGQFIASPEDGFSGAQVTAPLLSELQKIRAQQGGSFSQSSSNLTERFLATLSQQSQGSEDISSPSFVQEVVFPFLQNNKQAIIPLQETISVQRSVKTDSASYRSSLEPHLVVLAGAWQEIVHLSPESIDRKRFADIRTLLNRSRADIEKIPVPLEYTNLHRDVVRLSVALEQVITHAIVQDGNDPLRGILATALLDDIGDLGRKIVQEVAIAQTR